MRGASLFARTAIILALALVTFQSLALWVVYRTVIIPVAERSADDLAGLIVLSAQTWVELPPETRPAFEQELASEHGLTLRTGSVGIRSDAPKFSFRTEIEAALGDRLGNTVSLFGIDGDPASWVEIPIAEHDLRVGFLPQRYPLQVPLATVAIVGVGVLLSLVTALFIVRRIAVPLARAARAAAQMGAGETPEPLPETGPAELVELARRFNRMVVQVNELIENRTTLLAGISHDLRTPMTRLRLNLELLREKNDPSRADRAIADLEAMDALVATYLSLARSNKAEPRSRVDVDGILRDLANEFAVEYASSGACVQTLAPLALWQILRNLVENAKRYGGEGPVSLALVKRSDGLEIRVRDHGPGIADDQIEKVFRPFYRLEASRAAHTGGTGLGLAIVRQLAQSQGWAIELVNRAPEDGSGLEAVLRVPLP